jgi:hypothetical protein
MQPPSGNHLLQVRCRNPSSTGFAAFLRADLDLARVTCATWGRTPQQDRGGSHAARKLLPCARPTRCPARPRARSAGRHHGEADRVQVPLCLRGPDASAPAAAHVRGRHREDAPRWKSRIAQRATELIVRARNPTHSRDRRQRRVLVRHIGDTFGVTPSGVLMRAHAGAPAERDTPTLGGREREREPVSTGPSGRSPGTLPMSCDRVSGAASPVSARSRPRGPHPVVRAVPFVRPASAAGAVPARRSPRGV